MGKGDNYRLLNFLIPLNHENIASISWRQSNLQPLPTAGRCNPQRKIVTILIILLLTFSFIFPFKTTLSQVSEIFVKTYNGPGNGADGGVEIAVDSAGNAVVGANSKGAGTGMDFFLIKYSPEGDTLWTRRYNGSGKNLVTIQYNSSGQQQWLNEYNGPANEDDLGFAIAVDNNGNTYVTGANFSVPYLIT